MVKKYQAMKQVESGKGFPPPSQPKAPKPYVSAYNRDAQVKGGPDKYFCEVCNKHLNGPSSPQSTISKTHSIATVVMTARLLS